jgi:hypothetical protein
LLQNFLQFFCENTKTFAKTRKRKFKPNDNWMLTLINICSLKFPQIFLFRKNSREIFA